ncbi:MAG: tagaturonate reductase [Clostridiales bacterium]|nr:tagaturonate reductase [Clostridiales bacterium]
MIKPVNETVQKLKRPVKITQFGEGNFLRAFVDYMIDIANEMGVFDGSVRVVKPIARGSLEALRSQDCVYTVLLRGVRDGEVSVERRVVTCVDGCVDAYEEYEDYADLAKSPNLRFIVSNTTESGIVYDDGDDISLKPPRTYPGKLTKFLYERFTAFDGAADKGLIILPVELIEKNGAKLLEYCLKLAELWNLPERFISWLKNDNVFCGTLVDRIVTGYPQDEAEALEREFGYTDKLLDTGEPFALWVIECETPEAVAAEFPLDKAGLPVIFTKDLQPYRERKVRILNGAHTSSVLAAYLAGQRTVGGMMNDKTTRVFLEKALYEDLVPMVPLPEDEVRRFAASVLDRFENPYIKHNILSIALNSVSKFKSRVLPTIVETWEQKGRLTETLCFSFAALIRFYMGGGDYDIMDDAPVLEFFAGNASLPPERLTDAFLAREDFWGRDLTKIPGLAASVAAKLKDILDIGMKAAMENFLYESFTN